MIAYIADQCHTLCGVCKSRIVAIVALGFAAHWILELIAVGALARIACN